MDDSNKKLNILDIAKLAGVSTATVSRYLNGKFDQMSVQTRFKIGSIIDEHNYRPSTAARNLRNKSSKLIAFVVADIKHAFFSDVMRAMLDITLETRYHIIVWDSINSISREKALLKSLLDQNVEAIILNPVSYNIDHLKDLNINIPIILLNRRVKGVDLDIVKIAKTKALEKSFGYVESKGYEKTFLITEPYDNIESRTRIVQKFRQYLSKNNISKQDDYIYVVDPNSYDSIEKAVIEIIVKSGDNDIISATSGNILMVASQVITQQRKILGKNIGLIGFSSYNLGFSDNLLRSSRFSITRYVPNWYEVGIQIMLLLQEKIKDPYLKPKSIEIDLIFIEGMTTNKTGKE